MEIEETALPGIGLRHDFQTRSGRRLGVVSHHHGRRDLVIYDSDDPDSSRDSIPLTAEESDAFSELLGAPHIVEKLADISSAFAGLVGEQIAILADSPFAGRPLGDTQARTRTGASIVAVVRNQIVHASPPAGLPVRGRGHRGGRRDPGEHGVRRRVAPLRLTSGLAGSSAFHRDDLP